MKAQKNKIVFVLVLVGVVLFIALYAILNFGKDKETELEPDRIPMPDLEENQKVYESKMEALDALKEEREIVAPQIYPDHMVDDKGYFNPDYMEYEKQRIIDSIYKHSNLEAGKVAVKEITKDPPPIPMAGKNMGNGRVGDGALLSIQERGLAHQLFFAADPQRVIAPLVGDQGRAVLAYVDGNQTLRDGHRLHLRSGQNFQWNGLAIPKDARIYGFVKLRPNRVMVELAGFDGKDISLKVHDLQDGQEGIYVENHLKGEVMEQGLEETIGELNVPGFPQIGGLKRIFQRRNRDIKVDVRDKYQIVLKPAL